VGKYPYALPTQDDWSATNDGCGRVKSDPLEAPDLETYLVANEYNTIVEELIALASKQGINGSDPVGTTGLSLDFDFLSSKWMPRADRHGFVETWSLSPQVRTALGGSGYESLYLERIGTPACAFDTAQSNSNNALALTLTGGAVSEGIGQSVYRFAQQSSYMGARIFLSALPNGAAGEIISVGFKETATPSFVRFRSTATGAGTYPVWTVEIDNGAGGTASDVLSTGPSDLVGGGWITFEILTTSTGATFYYRRGNAAGQYKTLVQAPKNTKVMPFVQLDTDALYGGGAIVYCSAFACMHTDTRWS
jgi:hypothetical protein